MQKDIQIRSGIFCGFLRIILKETAKCFVRYILCTKKGFYIKLPHRAIGAYISNWMGHDGYSCPRHVNSLVRGLSLP